MDKRLGEHDLYILRAITEGLEEEQSIDHSVAQQFLALIDAALSHATQDEKPEISYCLFCGEQYPLTDVNRMVDHVRTCPKHPVAAYRLKMAEQEAEIAELKNCHYLTECGDYWAWEDPAGANRIESMVDSSYVMIKAGTLRPMYDALQQQRTEPCEDRSTTHYIDSDGRFRGNQIDERPIATAVLFVQEPCEVCGNFKHIECKADNLHFTAVCCPNCGRKIDEVRP